MIIATTVLHPPAALVAYARGRAAALGLPFRERLPNFETMKQRGDEVFLVYGKKGPMLTDGAPIADGVHVHDFHIGTAKLRLLALSRGGHDRLCDLLPKQCKTVLDATFGEGKDSLVLSYALGEHGQVTALEKSIALWEIGRWGIDHFQSEDPQVTAALRRIHLCHGDFKLFLQKSRSQAFDVVYFDTMFRKPVKEEENNRDAFRSGACYDLLDEAALREAMRVARYRVIVKERPFSVLFKKGLFHKVHHKRGQTTAYGVIDVSSEERGQKQEAGSGAPSLLDTSI